MKQPTTAQPVHFLLPAPSHPRPVVVDHEGVGIVPEVERLTIGIIFQHAYFKFRVARGAEYIGSTPGIRNPFHAWFTGDLGQSVKYNA